MRTLYSVLLLTFFVCLKSFAQTGELQGKVIDAETGKGIGFTPVVLLQNGTQRNGAYTDDNGNYVIKPIQPGTYTVKTSFTGFNPVEINGVVISSDKITFQDIKMAKTVTTIETVIITAEPKLVDPDRTQTGDTKTRTEIQQLATNRSNANDIVGTAAGVFQSDNGNAISVGGSRTTSNKYYVDGIPMRGTINLPSQAVEQLTLITGGIPAKYGDATGGVVNITTRGPSREFFGGVEASTSQFLDPYDYNLLNFSLAGPLLSQYRKTDSADARLGFFITAEYESNRDADPSAIGMWKVKDDVLEDITARPLQAAEIGTGFVQRAAFLTKDDLEKTDIKQNVNDKSYRFSTKFDLKLNRYTNLTVGGNADLQEYNDYDFIYQLYAPEHNLNIRDRTFRGFVRFTQRFAPNTDKENSGRTVFQNAYYSVQADYTKFYENYEDKQVGTNPFDYGYVGKFKTYRQPLYAQTFDDSTGLFASVLTGYQDTLVTFEPAEINSDLVAYTTNYYDLTGGSAVNGVYGLNGNSSYFQSLGLIVANGGIINGYLPGDIYSLWRATGYQAGEIRKLDNTQYRLAFSGSVDIVRPSSTSKGDKNRHALEFGFEYEQRDDRGYRIFPTNGNGMWGLARQLTNSHLALDLSNPQPVYVDGVFQDTINYEYTAGPGQSFFDMQLRNKLGIGATEFIDVDYLDPSQLSIDMFSPDELFSNGNNYIQYWGYDWKGNRLTSQPDFFDFFNSEVEIDGRKINDRPIGSFRPIYTAAYLQDKFNFKDLIFNIGLRVDRYDANQKVLKDPYSLFPIRTAGDVTNINGEAVTHPGNIDDDFYVYVNSTTNPSQVVGYRDGERWFDATGAEIADPNVIAQSTATGIISPYLQAGYTPTSEVSEEGFKDYEPQWSIMPRIAFSFPISEEALFFAHYDVLTQRPAFNRTSPFDYEYLRETAINARFNNPSTLR